MTKLSRRSFLQRMGVMTAGAALVPYLPASAAALPSPEQREQLRYDPTTLTEGGMVYAAPTDHGRALINPYMGWTLHYYSDLIENYGSELEAHDTVDEYPGIGSVFLRLPWAYLEPKEGEYQWEVFDTAAQRWIDNGQQVCLRVTASESFMYYASPRWLFEEAGAKGYDVPGQKIFEPEYDDPIFLEKVENFVRAMAERYDDNPNIAFVDVGHMGMWGEGHTERTSPVTGRKWGDQTRQRYIDIYCRHFHKTQIVISDDFAGPTTPGTTFPIMEYAFERGVTMRDDSILVGEPPEHWYHAEMAQRFWPTLPVVLEHVQYGHARDEWGTWNPDLLVESVEAYHASYMSIHWFPYEQLEGNREAIDRINRRIGYRLRCDEISWPAEVPIGEPFEIHAKLSNAGVAPCYGGGYLCYTLKDKRGGIVAVLVDESLDVKELEVGPVDQIPSRVLTSRFSVAPKYDDPTSVAYRPFASGEYDLFISIGRRDGTPLYRLPYEGEDGKRRYHVGRIRMTGEFPPMPLRSYYPGRAPRRGG